MNEKQVRVIIAFALLVGLAAVLVFIVPVIYGGLPAFLGLWLALVTAGAGFFFAYSDAGFARTGFPWRFLVRIALWVGGAIVAMIGVSMLIYMAC